MNRLVNRVTKVRDAIHSPKSVVALLVAITVLLTAASNIPAALTVTPDSRPSTFPDAVAPHTAFPTISSTMSLTDNLALYPPSPNPRFQPRIVPIANNSAHYRNSDDNLTPRPREKKITFRRYLDCLAQRLNVDRHRREELPFTNLTATIPYLLVIATVELRDVKALMCNIDVPVRRLMYVQNGPVGSVTRFFDDVQRAFRFTSRLKIVRYENNIGFAGAVNTGMRDAMQYSFDEVPFFHLTNNDVRFTPGLFSDVLPQFYEVTQKDKAVMEKLAAEVATEPNEFSPPTRRHRVLRTFSENGTTVVTSRLLPDRIRYSSNQKTAFKGHKGILFYDRSDTTATLSLSRLMMETVGFYDENFYPAYFEDVDIRWRYQGLGFDEYRPKGYGGSVTHFTNVVQKTGAVMYGKVSDTDVYAQHLLGLIRRMFPYSYASSKWGTADQFGAPYLRCKNPFCNQRMKDGGVAIDSFVIDERRRSAISADGFGVANFDERLVDHLR